MSVLILLSLKKASIARSYGNLPSDESSNSSKKGTIIYCIKFLKRAFLIMNIFP